MKNICHNFYRKIIFNASALTKQRYINNKANANNMQVFIG